MQEWLDMNRFVRCAIESGLLFIVIFCITLVRDFDDTVAHIATRLIGSGIWSVLYFFLSYGWRIFKSS